MGIKLAKYIFILIIMCSQPVLAHAQATDWEHMIAQMSQDDAAIAAQWEKAKKDVEKNEKNLTELADKHFQNSFDSVFGKDVFKPSEGVDVLKFLESASGGDFEAASQGATDFLIAKYTPLFGQYITLMKTTQDGIKSMEQVWINGLRQSKAHQNFVSILFDDPNYDRPYIPSYMITHMRNNKAYGPHVSKIYDEMRGREDVMFSKWMEDDVAVSQMYLPSWSSRWISARGKVPTDREMFNYFLYEMVKNSKTQYLEKLGEYYLEPLVRQEAYQKKLNIQNAMRTALNQIAIEAANGGGNNKAQCDALATQYESEKVKLVTKDQAFRQFTDVVYNTYTAKSNNYVKAATMVVNDITGKYDTGMEALKEEDDKIDMLKSEAESAQAKLEAINSDIDGIKNMLPDPEADPKGYNALVRRANAKTREWDRVRTSEFLPAARAHNEAVKGLSEKKLEIRRQYDQAMKARGRSKEQQLIRAFSNVRKSIQLYRKGEKRCATFSIYSIKDNMVGLIGMDPAPGIAICNEWKAIDTGMKNINAQRKEMCQ